MTAEQYKEMDKMAGPGEDDEDDDHQHDADADAGHDHGDAMDHQH